MFFRIAEIDWSGEAVQGGHYTFHALNQVVHVLETPGLHAVAVDGEVFALQGLQDEVGNHTSVVTGHARPVGVENADDFHRYAISPVIVHAKAFGTALAHVIAGTDAVRVDVPPITFGLWVDFRVAVDFTGRGLEEPAMVFACQFQQVERADDRSLGGFNGGVLIVYGRSRASQIIDFIDTFLSYRAW